MAFLDDLQKQNRKIVFIELNYLTPQLTNQKEYFADYHTDLPNGLTAGGDLFPAEGRIKSIPLFSRKMDVLSSKINKGVYTIKLDNNDGELRDFFTNNYFKNKEVNFYVTIEDYSPFDKLQLAQGTIKEIEIKDDYVNLKVDELIIFEKNIDLTQIELFDYPNQDTKLEDKYKPILKGKINNYRIEEFNINKLPEDTFVEVDVNNDSSAGFGSKFFYTQTDAEADFLRTIIKEGDFIELPDGSRYEVDKLNPRDSIIGDKNKQFSIVGINFAGNGKIKIQNKSRFNSPIFDDKYFVTKNVSILTSDLSSDLSAGDTTIVIDEDWNFLDENDIIFVSSLSYPEKTEEFLVDSYNPLTNTITIKGKIAIDKSIANGYKVNYHTVQKVRINNIDYYKKRNSFNVFPSLDGSEFGNNNLSASLSINGLTFTATSAGTTGNGYEIVFAKTKKYDPVDGYEIEIVDTSVTNKYGSKTRYTVNFYETATAQDIKDEFDLLTGLPFTVTVDSDVEIKEYFYNFNDKERRIYLLEGGEIQAEYYDEWIFQNITIDNNIPLTFALYFGVDGDTTIPTRVNSFDVKLRVDILSTDTIAQVNTKIMNTINTNNSVIIPFTCDEDGELKFAGYSKYPISKDRGVKDQNINFFEYIQDGDNFYIQFEKKAYNIARNGFGVSVVEYTVDIPGAYYSATESTNRKLISYASGYSRGVNAFVAENNFEKLDFLDTILILDYNNLDGGSRNKYLHVWKNADEGAKYVNSELTDFDLDEGIEVSFYPNEEFDEITVFYKDQYSHVSDIIEELFSTYSITKYNSSDLSTLKTDHPNFLTKLVIDESKKLYKYLNDFIISFNLLCFIDNSGDIRIKFFNPFDTATSTKLDFNSLIDFSQSFNELEYSRVQLGINEDLSEESFTPKNLTDEFTSDLALETNFDNLKEINSEIMKDFLDDTYETYKYSKLLGAKYLSRNHEIRIIGDLDLLSHDIGDLISVDNNNEIDSSLKFIITEIETDADNVKIKAFRLIENPERHVYLIDENGNNIIDENGNYIIGD
jgi:hypothetical protein